MRKVKAGLLIFSAMSFLLSNAFADQPTFQDPLLDHLVGNWVLQGTIAGSNTTHDVQAAWVMNHQYLRIHEISRELNPAGQPAYEATVFIGWDQPSSQYACVWLDTYGGVSSQSIGNAKRNGDEIPFLFKFSTGPFHTTFSYIAQKDSWTWQMDSEDNGHLTPFARVTLTHAR